MHNGNGLCADAFGADHQPWIVRVVEDQKLICVCTPANGGGELDAGLLGENMMLAAQSLGLGTSCLGGLWKTKKVALRLPLI